MVDIPANATTTAILEGSFEYGYSGALVNVGSFSGAIESIGDHEWIKVELKGGINYEFYLSFVDAGSLDFGESAIQLFDAQGNRVAFDIDSGVGGNSFLEYTAETDGTYFVDVGDFGDDDTGEYGLFVTRPFATGSLFLTKDADVHTGTTTQKIAAGEGNDTISLGTAFAALGEQGDDTIIGNVADNDISGGLGNDRIEARGGNDRVFGDAGNDVIIGEGGNDLIFGGAGVDTLYGGADADILRGGAGNDIMTGDDGADDISGGAGADNIAGGDGDDIIRVAGNEGVGDVFTGGSGADKLKIDGGSTDAATVSGFDAVASSIELLEGNDLGLFGTGATNLFDFSGLSEMIRVPFVDGLSGNDKIFGSIFDDTLRGGSGKDMLKGGLGDDVLTGGKHRDVLSGQGGKDQFDFNSIKESKKGGQRDVITDFQRGRDDIDLRGIDAKTGGGNQKFKFIGKSDFHDRKGELRYEDKGSKVIVQGDVNGDGKADFEIYVKAGALSGGDFLL